MVYNCPCGSSIRYSKSLRTHYHTFKHQNYEDIHNIRIRNLQNEDEQVNQNVQQDQNNPNDRIQCDCGQTILRRNIPRHEAGRGHQYFIRRQNQVPSVNIRVPENVNEQPVQDQEDIPIRDLTPIRSIEIQTEPIEKKDFESQFNSDDLIDDHIDSLLYNCDILIHKNKLEKVNNEFLSVIDFIKNNPKIITPLLSNEEEKIDHDKIFKDFCFSLDSKFTIKDDEYQDDDQYNIEFIDGQKSNEEIILEKIKNRIESTQNKYSKYKLNVSILRQKHSQT
jgi:hypothetical protein